MVSPGTVVRDVPVGAVPSYQEFVRHLWWYRDPDGKPAVGPPPELYRIILDDDEEGRIAEAAVQTAYSFMDLDASRVWTHFDAIDGEPVTVVGFADLESLHGFLKLIAVRTATSDAARGMGEFLMWTLGFRWV